ncbi:MAG: sugar ABC transporter permease [Limnochordia bacterium]|nr:sugar ABC transporter permease [Limnochordia bacterium]
MMRTKKYWKDTLEAYLYLLPAFLVLGMFSFYPVVKSVYMSFFDWSLLRENQYFVGLENYEKIVSDPVFRTAIVNTLRYVVGYVPISIGLGLLVAVLLNSKIRFRGPLRVAYFLPWVTSSVAISMVWRWIYNQHYGLLNMMLTGLAGVVNAVVAFVTFGNLTNVWQFSSPNWLMDPRWTIVNLVIIAVWQSLGYNMIIFLAGLQNIPQDIYEAAEVDGASPWQSFWKITFPLISPTTFFISIISIIGAFKLFTEVYVLYTGRPGPVNSGMTIVYYVYRNAFERYRMGYASAAAYILFAIIFIFTLVQMRASKRRIHYGS